MGFGVDKQVATATTWCLAVVFTTAGNWAATA